MRLAHHRVPMFLLGASFLAGCITRADIEEIKKNQKEILAKLDNVQKAGPQRPTPPQPQGPDPAKVYAFPIEDSPIKGPKDALVTLVEVSDFQ